MTGDINRNTRKVQSIVSEPVWTLLIRPNQSMVLPESFCAAAPGRDPSRYRRRFRRRNHCQAILRCGFISALTHDVRLFTIPAITLNEN